MCSTDKCGFLSLRMAVIFIAIFEMVHDGIFLALAIRMSILSSGEYMLEGGGEEGTWRAVVVVTDVVLNLTDFIFSLLLLRGVIKESVRQVMAWWWWTLVQLVVVAAGGVVVVVMLARENYMVGPAIAIVGIMLALAVCFLVVVRAYVQYVKRKKRVPVMMLSDDEDDDDGDDEDESEDV